MLLPFDGYCDLLSVFSLASNYALNANDICWCKMAIIRVCSETADDAGITRKQQAMATQCGYTSACSLHQVNRSHSGAVTVPR